MGANTAIAWAHHTFNPWVGCTKVGPGCDHCYAERDMVRRKFVEWGPGAPRRRTVDSNWKLPYRWDKDAARHNTRYRVFCASLADIFDNEVPQSWREDLWTLIDRTPNLDWLLLTKRIGNARHMLPDRWSFRMPDHVWLGITVVTQAEVDRDVPKLLDMRARVRWLSMEPLLERVDLCETFGMWWNTTMQCFEARGERFNPRGLDWVVGGGESGKQARPSHVGWYEALIAQCRAAGAAFFMKQGSEANWPAYKDFNTFPPALQVREFPR